MTILEAALTLGLSPDEITAEVVRSRYRDAAKHCHPDLNSQAGAADEFNRITIAFNTLLAHCDEAGAPLSTKDEVDLAAEQFEFKAWFDHADLWGSMSLFEKARSLGGVRIRPVAMRVVPKDIPLVVRTFGKRIKQLDPLLVAPVEVEIVHEKRREDDGYEMTLRPVETDRVREHLAALMADGHTLEAACRRLRQDLAIASRAPLRASDKQRRAA